MRVLYVLRYYPTLTETFVYREIRALQARGIEVEIAALGSRQDGALADTLPAVGVHRPPRVAPYLPRASALRALGPKAALRVGWLTSLASKFDRIHVHFAGEAAEWARVAARQAGRPYTVTAHAVDLFRPRPALREVLRDAAAVATVSEYAAAWIYRHYGVAAQLVRCGVESDRRPRARPDRSEGAIAVGRWVPKKGLDTVLSAMALLPEARLRLVSDPPQEALWGLENRVISGLLPPSRVAEALADVGLFVLPARVAPNGDRDGVPVAMMEAMAAGLPVISTRVSGIPELVDESTGWMVPVDDPVALAAAWREAMASPDERARRGANALKRVQNWSLEAQVEGVLRLWGASEAGQRR